MASVLQPLEDGDLRFQLGDRAGRGGLIDHLLLNLLNLGVRGVLQLVQILVERGRQVGVSPIRTSAPRLRSCSSRSRLSSRSRRRRSDW